MFHFRNIVGYAASVDWICEYNFAKHQLKYRLFSQESESYVNLNSLCHDTKLVLAVSSNNNKTN